VHETLVLAYDGTPLQELDVDEAHPLEVGRDRHCDVPLVDPEVPPRGWLLRRVGARVRLESLRTGAVRHLALDAPIRLGRHYSLTRRCLERAQDVVRTTEPLARHARQPAKVTLVVGRGERRILLDRPIVLGADESCDVVLADRAVSGRHCRIAPTPLGAAVRDLQSRNGTWVDGRMVHALELTPGSAVRIGRTDLRLVRRGAASRSGLVASSPEMRRVLAEVARYARLKLPVLVTGESGAGKEGIARALHEGGPRRDAPFIALNAGSLPATLIESELFGHERGAFTGAHSQHRGVFEQAQGGTLFLDEIAELPTQLQARLLRVLDGWTVRRVGGERAIPVDVRLVCATHRDLRAMTRDGRFREDLYYRIHQLGIVVPPLRDRPADVVALAEHFLAQAAGDLGARVLDEDAKSTLLAYTWPGNARELRNVVLTAAAHSPSALLTAPDLRDALARRGSTEVTSGAALTEVVKRHGGNVTAAARALGIARSTLRDRLRKIEAA